ncbi:MAG: hypothetical protein NT019_00920 [Candidatus Adlerbacteria bacterium]|nr:hypothetical protein [Candidatus Adlerbacteria bacterium]
MRAILFLVIGLVGMIAFGFGLGGMIHWQDYCMQRSTIFCNVWLRTVSVLVAIMGPLALGAWIWEITSDWFERKFGW